MPISLKINGVNVTHQKLVFSDGAVGVKLESRTPVNSTNAIISVISDKKPNDELFEIASLVDILRDINPRIVITLILPYLPYARQDRRMQSHDCFSLKVYTDFINSLKLDRIYTVDAHSEVGSALVGSINITQANILHAIKDTIRKPDVIVAPDAGAAKKALKGAEALGVSPENVVYLEKVRNTANGQIEGMRILSDGYSITGKNVLILDDLCDGGYTFVLAAQALKSLAPNQLGLFVTHGLFSSGLPRLFGAGLDFILTTDSVTQSEKSKGFDYFELNKIIPSFINPFIPAGIKA